MTPLSPLLETSDDELELALLKSAREDHPGQTGLRDTALALGLSAATAKALADSLGASQALGHAAASGHAASVTSAVGTSGGGSAAATLGSGSLLTLAKCLAAGAVVSFGVMAAVDPSLAPSSRSSVPVSARAARAPVRPAPSVVSRALAPAEVPPVAVPVETLPSAPPPAELGQRKATSSRRQAPLATDSVRAGSLAAPEAARSAAPPVAPPEPSAAPTVAPPGNASLAAEIRLLDRARAALAQNDAAGARRLLREYADSRPSAILSHEANLLRVRLLLAEGDRRAAAALARQIIAQHPESHHVDSLRSLAAEP